MRIAVIGSGAAGLAATRHLSRTGSGFTCVTYEQTDDVGGTWAYTDAVGKDKYGLPVHSSMYQSLITNGPKELLQFPDFAYKGLENQSYIPANFVFEYLNGYATHFGLTKYIKVVFKGLLQTLGTTKSHCLLSLSTKKPGTKLRVTTTLVTLHYTDWFHHHVKTANVIENEQWQIRVTDLATKIEHTEYFDGVIVCVGNFSNPIIPNHRGLEKFKGRKMHSHDYRKNEIFKDKRAVIVGCGASGLDITTDVLKVAKKIYVSHHSAIARRIQFPQNVTHKPDIACVTEAGVVFTDGTEAEVDIILYCTGYIYKYPFLGEEVGIKVEDQYVQPLYKHMINIEHPSMCFVGIPKRIPFFYTFDLQVRFFLKTLKNPRLLPSREAMRNDTRLDEIRRIVEWGHAQRQFHIMAAASRDYYNSLVEIGQLEPVPPVLLDMYFTAFEGFKNNFPHYRKDKYTILDEKNFVREIQ